MVAALAGCGSDPNPAAEADAPAAAQEEAPTEDAEAPAASEEAPAADAGATSDKKRNINEIS